MTRRVTWDGYLSLEVPSGWEWQEDEETISIFDPDGVGAVQISFAKAEDSSSSIEPEDFTAYFAKDVGFLDVSPVKTELGGLCASYFEGVDQDSEPSLWRVWSAGRNGRVATISYTCAESDRGAEKDHIDGMLDSLSWLF